MSGPWVAMPDRLSFKGVYAVVSERIEWIGRALEDPAIKANPMLREHWEWELENARAARLALLG